LQDSEHARAVPGGDAIGLQADPTNLAQHLEYNYEWESGELLGNGGNMRHHANTSKRHNATE
jgi:hypothetical protein